MQVQAYNSEKFERNTWRYIGFGVVFASILILSILNDNLIGAILLFFLLGAYFYYSASNNQTIRITIQENNLLVGERVYPRNTLVGYVIEIDPKTQFIKNLVLLTRYAHNIYTLHDTKDHIAKFISELDAYTPQCGDYHQNFIEKMGRRCKL